MSYDLMVFDVALSPGTRKAFLAWYDQRMDDDGVDQPKNLTAPLRAWFHDMIRDFPPLNGPLAPPGLGENEDVDIKRTEYSIGYSHINACFAWSLAESAHRKVSTLAAKHQVGFFDASSAEACIWLPDRKGGLIKLK